MHAGTHTLIHTPLQRSSYDNTRPKHLNDEQNEKKRDVKCSLKYLQGETDSGNSALYVLPESESEIIGHYDSGRHVITFSLAGLLSSQDCPALLSKKKTPLT